MAKIKIVCIDEYTPVNIAESLKSNYNVMCFNYCINNQKIEIHCRNITANGLIWSIYNDFKDSIYRMNISISGNGFDKKEGDEE